jgi:ATP-binding cassette subfamily C (CFTR/MRP) protein 1
VVKEDVKRDIAASKPLMQEEDRNTGQMDWGIYGMYLKAAGSLAWAPVILGGLLLTEAANGKPNTIPILVIPLTVPAVVTNLFLGWWTSNSIKNFKQSDYMGLYAGIGLAQALIVFINSFTFWFASYFLGWFNIDV